MLYTKQIYHSTPERGRTSGHGVNVARLLVAVPGQDDEIYHNRLVNGYAKVNQAVRGDRGDWYRGLLV